MPLATDTYPKDIVLFSDGTGNSASKPFKTNVWRTYQALDLHGSGPGGRMQVAFYRDGVGTETFKPLALLGGAFGRGVMRDVRALYVFLCRNYREGDRIYAFGFSRGAFTIRLLVGLVAACGLVQASSENELFHFSRAAYKAFRRDFLIRAARRRRMVYNWVLAPPCYVQGTGRRQIDLHLPSVPLRPDIDFLGLWDSVDAYGMPIDELKQGIDEWIWPMSLADRRLSPIVKRACHALSLDDERPTFRPLLWDQSRAEDRQRIEQVWFAGVHANVGGGYPIDDLSLVPLVWMLKRANEAGLRFIDEQVRYFEVMQNVHGTAYDSRSGVAGYYRYGPRSLAKLCDDRRHRVRIAAPVVHPSVVERMARRHRSYAPISLPVDLALQAPDSDALVQQTPAFVELAWDAVFWRRITYFATVALTFVFAVSPRLWPPRPSETTIDQGLAPVRWAVDELSELVPGWSKIWVDEFRAHWIVATPLILVFLWLFFFQSIKMQRTVSERSEWAWASLKGNHSVPPPHSTLGDHMVRNLRTSSAAKAFARWYERAMPRAVGATLLLLLLVLAGDAIYLVVVNLAGRVLKGAVILALLLTCFSFLRNARYRNEIDARLRETPGVPVKVPEHRVFAGYDAAFLQAFKSKAKSVSCPDGRNILEIYHSPVLLPNDLVLALLLGTFVALLGRQLAVDIPQAAPWFYASAVLGLAYAAFDAAEDMALAKVFGSRDVPSRTARVAPWLTRGKALALTFSVSGGLLFILLSAIGRACGRAVPSRF